MMNALVQAPKRSLVDSMAARYDMEPTAFVSAIKASVIKGDCSNEQFAAFLMVAKEYDLNPLTKEIYAFPDRGGIQPIVSIDGWMKLINSHNQFDGMEFDDQQVDGKLVSVTCRMYRKDRSRPISVIEYMSECARPTEPWKKWPARMLRHKAAIQAARYAFGFSGIMEPDEYDRMKDVMPVAQEAPSVIQRLQQRQNEPQTSEGFNKEFVDAETETLTSEPEKIEQHTPAEPTSSGSVEGGEPLVDQASTLDNSDEPAAAEINYDLRNECWDKFLQIVTEETQTLQERRGILETSKDAWKIELKDDLEFVRLAFLAADNIIKGKTTADDARENMSSLLEDV